jgi:hypothetical protein
VANQLADEGNKRATGLRVRHVRVVRDTVPRSRVAFHLETLGRFGLALLKTPLALADRLS